MQQDLSIPVIAIDGGAGTGKGTARIAIANELGFNSLDSGVLYRAVGLIAHRKRITANYERIAKIAATLDLTFDGEQVILNGRDETDEIRSGACSVQASFVAKIASVRAALYDFQLRQRVAPGLVADGRDMGNVFDTPYRYFLTASLEEQARRRVLQSMTPVSFADVFEDIRERDERDRTRAVSPLRPHPEAMVIDTTNLRAHQVSQMILDDFTSRHK